MSDAKLSIGGREFTVTHPPSVFVVKTLNLRSLAYKKAMESIKPEDVDSAGERYNAALDELVAAVHAALLPAHPDLTREEIEKRVPGTVPEAEALWAALWKAAMSGQKEPDAGEAVSR